MCSYVYNIHMSCFFLSRHVRANDTVSEVALATTAVASRDGSYAWPPAANSVKFITRQTIIRPVCLGVRNPFASEDKFPIFVLKLLLENYKSTHVWCHLWRGIGSLLFSCCWDSPVQPFSGLSPARLITIFYCFIFDIPPTCIHFTQEDGISVIHPGICWPAPIWILLLVPSSYGPVRKPPFLCHSTTSS